MCRWRSENPNDFKSYQQLALKLTFKLLYHYNESAWMTKVFLKITWSI